MLCLSFRWQPWHAPSPLIREFVLHTLRVGLSGLRDTLPPMGAAVCSDGSSGA